MQTPPPIRFPAISEIPDSVRVDTTRWDMRYLVDGEIRTWEGAGVWHERARCQPECAVIVQEPNGGRILAASYTHRPGRY